MRLLVLIIIAVMLPAIAHASGACCIPDGSCVVDTPTGCDARQGIYQGEGTDCDPNPCPQNGACCLAGGVCLETTESDCGVRGGTYLGDGKPCGTQSCLEVGGSCCLPDNSCIITSETTCYAMGGSFRGTGTVCAGAPCVTTTGACCYGDGTCVVKTEAICIDQQGSYQGNGTTCSPNPCAQPGTGACCLGEVGDCVIKSAYVCATLGGTYMGDNVACVAPNPCVDPVPPYQFEGHRFGVFTAISDAQALPYILQLVDDPDSLWWARQVNDERGWKPIKGASGVTACQTHGIPAYSQCYLCNDPACDDSLAYDLCCYYYSAQATRSTLDPLISTNTMMRFLIGGYDDIVPDLCTVKTLRGHWPQPVARMDSIQLYAAWMLSENPEVIEWQVGNEVDSPQYWGSPPNLYLDMVDTLRTQMLAACPTCRISVSFQLPGLGASYNPSGSSWWNQIGRRPNAFDIVDVHYNIRRWPSDSLLVRWQRTCPGKEMISLEVGITDSLYGGAMPDIGGTPTLQAKHLPRLMTMLFGNGFHRLSFNLFDNANGGKDSEFFLHASIVNEDGTLKPSFYAYKTMIRLLDRFTSCTKLCTGQYKYEFDDGRETIYHCWSQADGCPSDLLLAEDAKVRALEVIDYLGTVADTTTASRVRIKEGDAVYLRRLR